MRTEKYYKTRSHSKISVKSSLWQILWKTLIWRKKCSFFCKNSDRSCFWRLFHIVCTFKTTSWNQLSNCFAYGLSLSLTYRNIFFKNGERKILSVEILKIYSHRKLFSSNQLFSNFFSKTVTYTKFLPKIRESELLYFPHCEKEASIGTMANQ